MPADPGGMPTRVPPGKRRAPRCTVLYCGKGKSLYCGKGKSTVDTLIAGPDGVHIRNECLRSCDEVVNEEQTRTK